MPRFAIVEAPSILGLRPTGVEDLPRALLEAGLLQGLDAEHAGQVAAPPYDPRRDSATQILNPDGIRTFALRLAGVVAGVLQSGRTPVVLGGDCSILLGPLLALRRAGRYGLFFLDGHADFYQPEASPTGEAADMELALVSGRGPDLLADINGLRPLVRDEDVVVFGYRDADEAARSGSQDVRATGMHIFDLARVTTLGAAEAARIALRDLVARDIEGFWVHLDVDVVDDAIMPAVDYRLGGGLSFSELRDVLAVLVRSDRVAGMTITIFNPALDPDRSIARALVSCIVSGLMVDRNGRGSEWSSD